jgi:AcrR family transcriptional regulator
VHPAKTVRVRDGVPRPTRKGEILETFAALVADQGYDAVSLREVAERLDISKGTIIHHFHSKDGLLEQLHAEYMRRRLSEAEKLLERLEKPVEQLAAFVYQLMLSQRDDRGPRSHLPARSRDSRVSLTWPTYARCGCNTQGSFRV